jgi:hypothetical protein
VWLVWWGRAGKTKRAGNFVDLFLCICRSMTTHDPGCPPPLFSPEQQPRLVAACLSGLLFLAGLQAAQALLMEGPEGLRDVPRNILLLLEASSGGDSGGEGVGVSCVCMYMCVGAGGGRRSSCLLGGGINRNVTPPPFTHTYIHTHRACASPSSRPGRRSSSSTAPISGPA